ncbi:cyclic nucleotide-gated ion channel 16 [Pyrus ussuriensis x Pyrus communis]|uniref:Cyclic nucleotide-gated ion channel 16 n=1 Tax=Pyrus ussuriensis x Pyrus communis TaxID=2448454 RepID=A0A5N5I4P0_9ROSA|nr:cyclic nucleotide-gated ion channel 16 [Pyrus ussuriensis x Pyrus communis]
MMHSFQPYAAASARFHNFSTPFSLNKKIPWWYQILNPGSERVTPWNHIFFVICIAGLFLDPLYFFLPTTSSDQAACMQIDMGLDPGSRVFGRGQLVKDPRAIAIRYLKGDFSIDLAASLPLPRIYPSSVQRISSIMEYNLFCFAVTIWFVIPAVKNSTAAHATLSLIVLMQYIPRFIQLFPLNRQITKSTGVVAKTAWSGAAYNLVLFCLIAHVRTWPASYIYVAENCERKLWLKITKVETSCDAAGEDDFEFGMFAEAFTNEVASAYIIEKNFYCLWWGMRNLCSYGQDIKPSTFISETSFCILIAVLGLVLFSHLMSQMQTYLQSATIRLEEWRVKRRDRGTIATIGVDEKNILQSLPVDLRRQIQRHLCLALVCRVPFFAQMDDQLLDAICERLESSHTSSGKSSTTDGGRTGFYNSTTLKRGDFCGEELLTWALMPTSSLPCSTRTVRSLTEVEALALKAEDLKYVANQFKRLPSKKLQHAFRYYSHQWRTWGLHGNGNESIVGTSSIGGAKRSSSEANLRHSIPLWPALRGIRKVASVIHHDETSMPKKLFKPDEPDFSAD